MSRLGSVEAMAAMGLGDVIIAFVDFLILGMTKTLNKKPAPKLPQTYEALARTRFLVFILLIPSIAWLLCTEPLLLAIRQEPLLCEIARDYVYNMIPGVILKALYDCNCYWLASRQDLDQRVNVGIMVIAVGNHILWGFLFVGLWDIGLVGACYAYTVTNFTNLFLLSFYTSCADPKSLAIPYASA